MKPNYEHYKRFEYWTIDECVMLINDQDPKGVSRPLKSTKMYDIVKQNIEAGSLMKRPVNGEYVLSPLDFVVWAKEAGYSVPTGFEVQRYGYLSERSWEWSRNVQIKGAEPKQGGKDDVARFGPGLVNVGHLLDDIWLGASADDILVMAKDRIGGDITHGYQSTSDLLTLLKNSYDTGAKVYTYGDEWEDMLSKPDNERIDWVRCLYLKPTDILNAEKLYPNLRVPKRLPDLHKMTEEVSEIIPPYLDNKHEHFAPEIKIAVDAWMDLYGGNETNSGAHSKLFLRWINKSPEKISDNAKKRIQRVTNPKNNKKGGAPPTPTKKIGDKRR